MLQDKISFEVMGANEWRHVHSLSAMSNDILTFYLGNTRVNEHYKLDTIPSAGGHMKQEVNFADRSDTSVYEYKIIDSIIEISNTLTFISRSFDKPIIIDGSFIGQLQASVNKKDMDISISIYELMPDGKYLIRVAGWKRNRASDP